MATAIKHPQKAWCILREKRHANAPDVNVYERNDNPLKREFFYQTNQVLHKNN